MWYTVVDNTGVESEMEGVWHRLWVGSEVKRALFVVNWCHM